MSQKYYTVLTDIGANKLANATALGGKLNITTMAVGDGGGSLPMPEPGNKKLVHENRRGAINQLSVDPENPNHIIAEQIIPEQDGGWWVREIAIFDEDGDMIAIGNCPESYKPKLQEGSGRTQIIRMILVVSSAAAVTLKIDPSVILATQKYVTETTDKKIKESEQKAAETYQPKGNYAPAGNYAVRGECYTKTESDGKYQPKGSYAPAGNYAVRGECYTKTESDGKYQPKGSYAPAGNYAVKGECYTKAESDGKYQPKGSYAPAGNYAVKGECYTKAESDGKYQPKGADLSELAIGINQKWANVSSQRSPGVNYTNGLKKPLMINIYAEMSGNNAPWIKLYVAGALVAHSHVRYDQNLKVAFVTAIVPPGNTYSYQKDGTTVVVMELR